MVEVSSLLFRCEGWLHLHCWNLAVLVRRLVGRNHRLGCVLVLTKGLRGVGRLQCVVLALKGPQVGVSGLVRSHVGVALHVAIEVGSAN